MYVNAPRYLLRKSCVLKLLKDIHPRKVLDVGCGAGDMVHTLADRGAQVLGIDFSNEAIRHCQQLWKGEGVRFENTAIENIHEQFDLIVFMEVLEHIEDDAKALEEIHRLLNQKGYLILSVPAHKDRFGPSDHYVGHFRRYDKNELLTLLEQGGFQVEVIWSYGVPLANITESIRNWMYRNKSPESLEEGTKQSGIDRHVESKFRFLLNDVCLFPFYLLQKLFLNTNLGTGYILRASKS
jgi:cyclopropane fatty-acyl-phospholipid synthase-like methyltransferase